MIMPIGIIQQPTEEGATFRLTRPGDHSILKTNSPVVVLKAQIDQEDIISGVMVRGQITKIGPTTAAFTTAESWADPTGPKTLTSWSRGALSTWPCLVPSRSTEAR